jgi:hypothetical protein
MLELCSVLKIFTIEGSQLIPDSNLAALNHACEYLQPAQTFNNIVLAQTNEPEIEALQMLLRFSRLKPENALIGDSMAI